MHLAERAGAQDKASCRVKRNGGNLKNIYFSKCLSMQKPIEPYRKALEGMKVRTERGHTEI